MFENYTYEELLATMLSEVPTDVDKREGSIIFDTLSPAALELAKAYMGMDSVLNNAFAETAISTNPPAAAEPSDYPPSLPAGPNTE